MAPDGSLYVADPSGHRVCAVTPEGETRTVAGGANGYRDGSAVEALFRYPHDVSLAPDGSCYVADTGNDRIRRIAPDGTVTTVAGSIYDYGDGQGTDAHFRRPTALEVGPDGTCYVADTGNNTIRRIDLNGTVTTVAGALPGGDADGAGRDVGLRWPTGIAVGPDGTIWIADHGNGVIRRLGSNRESRFVYSFSGRTWPVSVAWHSNGTLVVSGVALHDLRRPEAWLLMVIKARWYFAPSRPPYVEMAYRRAAAVGATTGTSSRWHPSPECPTPRWVQPIGPTVTSNGIIEVSGLSSELRANGIACRLTDVCEFSVRTEAN